MTAPETKRSASGRELVLPALKGRLSQRLATLEDWMVREAIVEAQHSGQTFVAESFRCINQKKGKYCMTDSDRATINDYLFDPKFRLPLNAPLWKV